MLFVPSAPRTTPKRIIGPLYEIRARTKRANQIITLSLMEPCAVQCGFRKFPFWSGDACHGAVGREAQAPHRSVNQDQHDPGDQQGDGERYGEEAELAPEAKVG